MNLIDVTGKNTDPEWGDVFVGRFPSSAWAMLFKADDVTLDEGVEETLID
jgi:hypothetical protein